MQELWNKNNEKDFFTRALDFATPGQLFYRTPDGRHFAYWPDDYKGPKTTLQSRNALIGDYTEKYSVDLLKSFAQRKGYYVVQKAICSELELPRMSPADVAICRTPSTLQNPENIVLIIEVKMSIVWNWELKTGSRGMELNCVGDYRTHQGNPGLLRSDTMLKAIGKSLNVRVSSIKASKIPILVLGNTPISANYYEKVDSLKKNGIIQGFWSVNPQPLDNDGENIKSTEGQGFCRIDSYEELFANLQGLLDEKREFFASMRTRDELGRFIELANMEPTYERKAEKFLSLLRGR